MICLSVSGLLSAAVLVLSSLLFLMPLGSGKVENSRPLIFKVTIPVFDFL